MNTPLQDMPSRRRAPALDVAVVGGGMVGAAAALALARAGFSTALLEARAPAAWDARAEVDLRVVGLAPSSIALLDELGVWTSIRDARVGPYTHMHVWDAESGAAIDFDAASEGRDRLGCIVENSLVQWTLWQALEAAGVRCLCPAEVQGFEALEDRIQLELAGGETLSAGLLVAADGAGSPLRALAGIGTRGRDYAQRAVVAHVATERPHQDTAWQRFLPGGPLALLPLADGRSSIVWSLPEAEAQRVLALDEQAFLDELGVASDFRLGRIFATTPRAAFPLKLQLAERYQAERFVLLGDAAHAVHPLAGQGVNLGLRDVVELRDTLLDARAAGRDIGAAHVLRRYARRRRSADTLDALGFDALARIYAWQSPALVAARGIGVRLLDRLAPLKRQLSEHAAGL
ncbi:MULTISPECIES: UbiH/UbiF/VisC/COQ6 family ubiquinone biosynthesis hydroxylase [Rhodanobacter]|uniref:UbiH/UbiF/VisC/COQ6 family ubiquinone biosynthesis hydroxylase n=1 Tax=Rhodanobacter TaxID=75309 RepID=UPI000424E6A8|nr:MULTISPECIES: UbiH/UbiF/VisC/COQ6 family ubiquinone biosynthesis hydroxylase [Rhodanobacter]KZC20126.1 2-octaprenyl-3-methyl-6-methoxy-1,4-benzoquinol hydroxylase [Rhodanobacter denitrificans]UJJ50406.1 UbiH/UbiF/VisC/COQ6 family ubiquinone biosynthesis hydroxylase [Rhodanobacter denitrificans]UJJ57410.1 UbiH/UbiF/VisC/COQ6 family ubiquinone biosynthesis hydroxylase [Rhodanobacter denitrificans]UJM93120.1 UbiH/UbiF/VisC/COQ6 family ubiquinone biosynthesis hydroxylase [Rhodanobacter denitrifi